MGWFNFQEKTRYVSITLLNGLYDHASFHIKIIKAANGNFHDACLRTTKVKARKRFPPAYSIQKAPISQCTPLTPSDIYIHILYSPFCTPGYNKFIKCAACVSGPDFHATRSHKASLRQYFIYSYTLNVPHKRRNEEKTSRSLLIIQITFCLI